MDGLLEYFPSSTEAAVVIPVAWNTCLFTSLWIQVPIISQHSCVKARNVLLSRDSTNIAYSPVDIFPLFSELQNLKFCAVNSSSWQTFSWKLSYRHRIRREAKWRRCAQQLQEVFVIHLRNSSLVIRGRSWTVDDDSSRSTSVGLSWCIVKSLAQWIHSRMKRLIQISILRFITGNLNCRRSYSFCSLSYDRSTASYIANSPQNAI
jgi:hypothetical protein